MIIPASLDDMNEWEYEASENPHPNGIVQSARLLRVIAAYHALTARAVRAEQLLTELQQATSEYELDIAAGDWKADLATCRCMGCMSPEPRLIVTLPDGSQRMAKEKELTALLRIRATVGHLAPRPATP